MYIMENLNSEKGLLSVEAVTNETKWGGYKTT